MHNVTRVLMKHRQRRLRIKFFALLWIGAVSASAGYGQTGQYLYQTDYPASAYQSTVAAPNAFLAPQPAQNPYVIPQQPQADELPPPLVYNNPQSPSYGYNDPAKEPGGGNINPYGTGTVNRQQPEQVVGSAQQSQEMGQSELQETSSELVIADSLGPAVADESWIHGSWRSFCQTGCVAGFEGSFLSIQTDSFRSVVATDLLKDQTLQKSPEDGFGAGYRTWLGLQNGAVGFRLTYWAFENSFYEPSPNFVPWNTFAFYDSNMLRAHSIDVEFLQRFCIHQSWLETTLGARYASLDRSGLLQGSGKLGGVNLLGSSATNCELEGWGGVASIGGWLPIFCKEDLAPGCYHPWSLFWKCQGSALQAQSKVQAITLANAIPGVDKFSSAYSRDEAIADWDGMIGIGMLQVGLDYRCPITWLDCSPASLHFRSGFEGQYWQTGRIGVQSQSAATLSGEIDGSQFGGAIISRANANPEDLVLLGFFVSASLSY